jgi:RND family efflux transporter MFP subunit
MSADSRVTMQKSAAALIGVALLMAGAGVSYLLMRKGASGGEQMATVPARGAAPTPAPAAQPAGSSTAPSTGPLPDVVVSLSAQAVQRAGIVVAPVMTGTSPADIRLPGVVEPNAYRQVTVTPLISGRVTRVSAELGTSVRRGQTLAQIYSPELAEAQTKYVSAKAMLDAHDRELQRTQKLVEIGAASRQELERIHAEHSAQAAAVQSARSQLELLGVPSSTVEALGSGSKVNATTSVAAPVEGVITERAANVGLNVDPTSKLFTIVDLSTVWVVADVYEKDFSRVRVGSDTTITAAAWPGLSRRGRVSYIDPQMNPETRTAKVRVEVPNPRGELRLGMYVEVVVTGAAGPSVPVIPRTAVQNVGDRTVVYLVNPKESGKFTEREVRLGEASGQQVEVASGVQPGDAVVTEGSFFVRAERERLGLRPSAGGAAGAGPTVRTPSTTVRDATDVQSARVVVTEQGFDPARITLRVNAPARLTFIRRTDKTCATEVVFPSLNIKRALPLNEPVVIAFTPSQAGDIAFACGMNMLRGAVVVQ